MVAGDPKRQCRDCLTEGITTKRAAPHPGPRCASHNRVQRGKAKAKRHAAHIAEHFGLTDEEYDKVKAYQNGKCWGCQRATGAKKNLAVEHDHKTLLLRSLTCGTCNLILGRARDDAACLRRLADSLENSVVTAALGYEKYAPQNRTSGWRRGGRRWQAGGPKQ
jgi:Recombination endonuclease VII